MLLNYTPNNLRFQYFCKEIQLFILGSENVSLEVSLNTRPIETDNDSERENVITAANAGDILRVEF